VILCMNIVCSGKGVKRPTLAVRVLAPGGTFKRDVVFWSLQNINGNQSQFKTKTGRAVVPYSFAPSCVLKKHSSSIGFSRDRNPLNDFLPLFRH